MSNEKKSFWTTLPGILTGIAAIISAIAALCIAFNAIGFPPTPTPTITTTPTPTITTTPTPTITATPDAGFRVVEVFLRADPFDYTGPCPIKIKFSGRISVVGGNGMVSYKFLRSDGASAPIQTLMFDSPGSNDVSTTWTLGKDYSGWQSIQIFEPQELESNQASFKIKCQ